MDQLSLLNCGSLSTPSHRSKLTRSVSARWVLNDYSSYSSVTDMLSNLGWRSLENRRTDTRLAMFYKIVYGLVYPWDTRPEFKMWEELPKSVFMLVVSYLSTSI